MSVYVDEAIMSGHCKMWADTADEMHAAADRASIHPKWFSGGPTEHFPHYVANPSKRALLIKHGAIPVGRDAAWKWQTHDWFFNGSPVRREIACERIKKYGKRTDLLGPLV